MIDDRIGTIGSTQGVKVRPSPARKNRPRTMGRLASPIRLLKRPSWLCRAGGAAAVVVAAFPPVPLPSRQPTKAAGMALAGAWSSTRSGG